jgi:hypothetical protein
MLSQNEVRPILLAIIEKRRREAVRYQALVLATAKLIYNADLSPIIVRKLNEYLLESGGSHREPASARKKR